MADPLIVAGLPNLAQVGLAIQQAQWATLAELLKPGALLTAQVGEPLGNNTWQVHLAGRSVVAESPSPLISGSIIQVEVLSNGPQPQLRLITTSALATLTASDPATQLAHLGLPDEPATRTVLAAFIHAGAPLVRERLADAIAAVHLQPHSAELAAAHATIARSGLPIMPLTIALALRTVQSPTVLPTTNPIAVEALGIRLTPAQALPIANAHQSIPAPAFIKPNLVVTALPPPSTSAQPALPDEANIPITADTLAIDLHSAGLRKAEVPATTVRDQLSTNRQSEPTPLARIAHAILVHGDGPHAAELRSALVNSSAHTIFPPPELADYDLVLPIPLREQGQPIPARLAVTTRKSGDSATATWLRVDTALSRLGQVSVRLAAVDQGPLIVHVIATQAAHASLSAVMPELEAALAAKGLTASIRLSTTDD